MSYRLANWSCGLIELNWQKTTHDSLTSQAHQCIVSFQEKNLAFTFQDAHLSCAWIECSYVQNKDSTHDKYVAEGYYIQPYGPLSTSMFWKVYHTWSIELRA